MYTATEIGSSYPVNGSVGCFRLVSLLVQAPLRSPSSCATEGKVRQICINIYTIVIKCEVNIYLSIYWLSVIEVVKRRSTYIVICEQCPEILQAFINARSPLFLHNRFSSLKRKTCNTCGVCLSIPQTSISFLALNDNSKWSYLSVTFCGIKFVLLHPEIVSESSRGGHSNQVLGQCSAVRKIKQSSLKIQYLISVIVFLCANQTRLVVYRCEARVRVL